MDKDERTRTRGQGRERERQREWNKGTDEGMIEADPIITQTPSYATIGVIKSMALDSAHRRRIPRQTLERRC